MYLKFKLISVIIDEVVLLGQEKDRKDRVTV